MVPIPKLPTDNLYKFIALAGLCAVGLGSWIIVHASQDIEDRVDNYLDRARLSWTQNDQETQEALSTAQAQIADAENASAETGKWLADAQKGRPVDVQIGKKLFQTSQTLLESAKRQGNVVESRLRAKTVANKIIGTRLEAELAGLDGRWRFVRFSYSVGYVLIFIGLIATPWGFRQWYSKVQKPQDLALSEAAASVASENQS